MSEKTSKIQIKTLVLGPLLNNCYIIYAEGQTEALLVDASFDSNRIVEAINSLGLSLKYVLITHGHIDHVVGSGLIRDETGAKIMIHRDDLLLYDHVQEQGQMFGFHVDKLPQPDGFLDDGQHVAIAGISIQVIHTPGHSPGGLCYLLGDNLFTGDTLFQGSIGRTDLCGGDYEQLIKSIKEKLFPLGEEISVYPGHGEGTQLGRERMTNPFLI